MNQEELHERRMKGEKVLECVYEIANGKEEIKISSIQNDPCNAGKIFNLDIITLTALLYKIELMGYIKVIRTAGLDVIRITKDISFIECIEDYYKAINK